MAFEAVVLRHSEAFSAEAVAASEARLERLRDSLNLQNPPRSRLRDLPEYRSC